VNQTRPHCVNKMGKTYSKLLATRHGRGTAWARHAMCESTLIEFILHSGIPNAFRIPECTTNFDKLDLFFGRSDDDAIESKHVAFLCNKLLCLSEIYTLYEMDCLPVPSFACSFSHSSDEHILSMQPVQPTDTEHLCYSDCCAGNAVRKRGTF